MKEFTIRKNDAGQRLDRFIAKSVPLLPASLAQKYIRIKRIKINGRGADRDAKLSVGDTVQMYINDEFFDTPSVENAYLRITSPNLDIIYEDENILLVNKEAGVLCHSGGNAAQVTLIDRIQAHLYLKSEWKPREENSFTPALCNRIDRNTSGIVIAAKNAEALRIINEKIKVHEIDKYYLCIVHGRLSPPSGRLEGYLFKDAAKNRVFVHDHSQKGTRTAVTEYKTLAYSDNLSLLECLLLTGRTHQIRAQLADARHPLLGDGKYGSEKLNHPYRERVQALCSYKLIFSFKTDASMLNYLNGNAYSVRKINFVDEYFPKYTVD